MSSHNKNLAGDWKRTHDAAVQKIAEQVKGFHNRKETFRIFHGSTNSTRIISLDPKNTIDTSRLSRIHAINEETSSVWVEPNVAMDRLVRQTMKYCLVPAVVPEFPGITVGGAFSGTAAESSSFKHGFFDSTVLGIEIILGNGTIVASNRTNNADLFHGAIGTFGSLGIITFLQLQLVPALKYVQLTYLPLTTTANAVLKIEEATKDPKLDYIDAIILSPTTGVLILGHGTSLPTKPLIRFTRAHDPWFYLHAATAVSTIVTVPLYDYLFRYDRGAFWMGSFSFHRLPFNPFARWLLNPLMSTRNLYKALHASGRAQRFIIQDLALPLLTAPQFLTYLQSEIDIYPLWLCPLLANTSAPMHAPRLPSTSMLLNIGLWGPGPQGGYEEFVAENRALEAKVRELGGRKWLYAQVFCTEEQFWEGYERVAYEGLRAKYCADGLLSVWEKVKGGQRVRESGIAGLLGVLGLRGRARRQGEAST